MEATFPPDETSVSWAGSTFDPASYPPGYLYELMAEHLANRIRSGELRPDTPLPAERRLAQEYGVSLGTARHATELLRTRGLVMTVRSKGTYVVSREDLREACGDVAEV